MLKQVHQTRLRCRRHRSAGCQRRRQWIVAIVTLGLATSAGAQTVELEPFVIEVTGDWTARSREAAAVSLTINSADHQPELTFTTRKRGSGTPAGILRQWFGSLGRARESGKQTGNHTVRPGRLSNGVAAWMLEPGGQTAQTQIALAIEKDRHLLLASLTAPAASADKLARDFGAMMLSAADGPGKASAGVWPAPSRRLSGFYATIGSTVSLSLLARTRHLIGINGLLLAQDGRFALTETAMGSTLTQACEQQPIACGHYDASETWFSGWRSTNLLEHSVGFLREDQRSLVSEPDGTLIIGGARYQRIKPNEPTTLDGRFRSASTGQVDGPDGERLNAYRETLFTFRADGRFEQSELKALTRASTGTPLSLSSSASPKQGNYRISDFALELNFEDSAPVTYPMFMLQGVPVINGSMYKQLKPITTAAPAAQIKPDK